MLCVICSAGGHLSEALEAVSKTNVPMYFVTFGEPHARLRLSGKESYYVVDPHTSLAKYLVNIFQSVWILLKKRPKVIFSTGAGIALATCVVGRIFGAKIIFLESGARISTPSKTGKLMYKIAHVFIVQWKPMLKVFPSAKYVGPLL